MICVPTKPYKLSFTTTVAFVFPLEIKYAALLKCILKILTKFNVHATMHKLY